MSTYATFLVSCKIDTTTDLQSQADRMLDSLQDDGFDVESVKPWKHSSDTSSQPSPSPEDQMLQQNFAPTVPSAIPQMAPPTNLNL